MSQSGYPMSEQSELSEAEREASRWLVRLESPDVSLDDHKQFRAWLNACPANRVAFESLSRTWDRLDALRHLTGEPLRRKVGKRTLVMTGLTAAAALVAGVLVVRVNPAPRGISYATSIGERETVRLEDGSTVELDAGSRIEVAYGDNQRTVRVERGAAFFNVGPDSARPFLVETAYGIVRVRGTSFLVKLGDGAMRTTIVHGVVEAEEARQAPFALFSRNHGGERVIGRANQEIAFAPEGLAVRDISPQTAQRRLAWRDGMLAFDGETLREAVMEVERHTGVRFDFEDPALADLRVGGYINAQDIAAFTDLLRDSLNVGADQREGNLIILRRMS